MHVNEHEHDNVFYHVQNITLNCGGGSGYGVGGALPKEGLNSQASIDRQGLLVFDQTIGTPKATHMPF